MHGRMGKFLLKASVSSSPTSGQMALILQPTNQPFKCFFLKQVSTTVNVMEFTYIFYIFRNIFHSEKGINTLNKLLTRLGYRIQIF